MSILVNFLRYALRSIGWDAAEPANDSFVTTDLRGRRWRVTCEAVKP